MPTTVALDFGTSYLKAALFDEAGTMLALHRQRLRPSVALVDGWELDPAGYKGMILAAFQDLRARAPEACARIAALSFATQTNSFVLLDGHDLPLTPLILWPDYRAETEPELVSRFAGLPRFGETTGVAELSAGFMLPKLAWLQRHRPEVWARTKRLCLLSDFVTLWMTGQHVTEAGAAGLTGLMDVAVATWWPAACERAGLAQEMLPSIVRAGTDLGPLRAEVAEDLGVLSSCHFVVGCLDQYAGAIGTGNVLAGGVSETTGTVLATVRCTARLEEQPAPGVYQGCGCAPGLFYQMLFGSAAANLLEAFRNSLPDRPGFAVLDAAAAEIPPGCGGLRADATAEGPRFTKTPASAGHGARAIMEAVAWALREQVQRLCGSERLTLIRSAGGAARSRVWLQIKADVLDVPLAATLCAEPTCLGAAMLAGAGRGWGSVSDFARSWVRTGPVFEPDAARHAVYECQQAVSGKEGA